MSSNARFLLATEKTKKTGARGRTTRGRKTSGRGRTGRRRASAPPPPRDDPRRPPSLPSHRTVHAGFLAIRAYPSTAPAQTVSCRPSTGRTRGSASSAPTSHISVVPGFAKHASTPRSASAFIMDSAPVGAFGLSARVSTGRFAAEGAKRGMAGERAEGREGGTDGRREATSRAPSSAMRPGTRVRFSARERRRSGGRGSSRDARSARRLSSSKTTGRTETGGGGGPSSRAALAHSRPRRAARCTSSRARSCGSSSCSR